METPWQILDVDADSATKKEAKRSYARLLKQNRPDEKPEEFQKIREAYDAVTYMIQQREWEAALDSNEAPGQDFNATDRPEISSDYHVVETDVEDFSDQLPSARAIEFSESNYSELNEIYNEVISASEIDDTEELEKSFRKGVLFTHDFPDSIDSWGRQITSSKKKFRDEICGFIEWGDIVFELENDCRSLSDLYVLKLHGEKNFEEIRFLEKVFQKEKHRLSSPVAAAFLIDLARRIAAVIPNTSSKLVDLAYPHLAPGYRNYQVAGVEHQSGMGKMFSNHLIQKRRAFWDARAHDMEFKREFDWWNDEEARGEIALLIDSNIPPQIADELLALMPDDLKARLVKNASKEERLAEAKHRLSRHKDTEGELRARMIIGSLVLGLIYLISLVAQSNAPERQLPTNEFEFQKMVEDLKKKPVSQFELIPGKVESGFRAPLHLTDQNGNSAVKQAFDPRSLRSPGNGLIAGSAEHLAVLEKGVSDRSIDLEYRLTIPDIIVELGDPKQADDILQRIQNADIEEEIINRAFLNRVTIQF